MDDPKSIVCGEHTFEVIDYIPYGYEFWNIGKNMADGYLPLCQGIPGSHRVNVDTLKAIKLDGAQTVLAASVHGPTTIAAMEEYLERYKEAEPDSSEYQQMKRVQAALEVLKGVKQAPERQIETESDRPHPCRFHLGDKVKIPYIADCYRHNNEVGEVTWIHPYKFYPGGDPNNHIWKYQMEITYPDGQSLIADPDVKTSGLVSEVVLVEPKSPEHSDIAPLLEHDEMFEMNCLVYDAEGNFRYEAFFSAKSGWLQDYFGVDNRCQLEALWDIGDSWEDPENFIDALREAEYSGFQINALVRGNVKVEWTVIGEGLHGDYDPMDPEDVELLRFSVFVLRDGGWEEKADASYCSQFPVSATAEEKLAGLEILLEQFHDALSADIDASVKKLGEQMSWIDIAVVSEYIAALDSSTALQPNPAYPNATDNLIKAMVAYGLEFSWSDSKIIHSLTNLGVTYDDFCHAGAQDFIKNYLEAPSGKKTALSGQISSALPRAAASHSVNKTMMKETFVERF